MENNSDKKVKIITKEEQNQKAQNQHKCFEVISNEKKVIEDIDNLFYSFNDIFSEIKIYTKDYCSNIYQIIGKINDTQKDIEKNPEREIENNFCEILKQFVEIIMKYIINMEIGNKSEQALIIIDKNLKEKEEILILDIDKLESIKEVYYQEYNEFELSLIKEELNINNENISKYSILEVQKAYIEMNKKLKDDMKKIFEIINIKRKYLIGVIFDAYQNFLKNINIVLDKMHKLIEEENSNIFNYQTDNYMKQVEDKLNDSFKEDFYEFKFLTKYKKDISPKNKIINEKNEFDDLLEKLSGKNIEHIIDKLKNYDIHFTSENLQQIDLIETKKIMNSNILSIINSSNKLDKKKKENFFKELKSSSKNQLLFLECLNNHRGKGKLDLQKEVIKYFSELFSFIIELYFKKNDFQVIKLCVALSQTYYHEEKKEKIYIINYLRKSKIFKEKIFWEKYLKGLIDDENKKSKTIDDIISFEKQKSATIFSIFLTFSKNMIDFGLELDFIINLINKIFDLYEISDDLKKDIINYLISEIHSLK